MRSIINYGVKKNLLSEDAAKRIETILMDLTREK